LGQGYKCALRHVLGQVGVAHHAKRSGIDEVNVPPYEFCERRFRPMLGVTAQKLIVGQTVHSQDSTRRRSNRTGNIEEVMQPNGADDSAGSSTT
jgi:hypothetical protein